MNRLFRLPLIFLVLIACNSKPLQEVKRIIRKGYPEKYLLPSDSSTVFDSTALQNFIDSDKTAGKYGDDITQYYRERGFSYAWFHGSDLRSAAYTLHNLVHWSYEAHGDTMMVSDRLDSLLHLKGRHQFTKEQKEEIEFLLSTQFFDYAHFQYEGHIDKDLRSLDWFIPRGKKNYSMLLDSLVAGVADLSESEPVNRRYKDLKVFLMKYDSIRKIDTLSLNSKLTFSPGAHSTAIKIIRRKLALREDLPATDTVSDAFDESLRMGVRSFRQRMGLSPVDKIDAEFIERLNEPVALQMRTMLVNMERLRWVPESIEGEFILVNIPEYKLHVNNDTVNLFSMNVVVGKEGSETVIFNGKLSEIVFSPYWNVPQSIFEEELIPQIQKDPAYLDKNNMEVLKDGEIIPSSKINWKKYSGSENLRVRQRPGPDNSLGHIKFLFPNKYSIYLHDTPSRHLFDQTGRSYSHGCIRVQDPVKLAEFLLRDQPQWTTEKIEEAMFSGDEKFVKIKKKIPVFICYFTAWVDEKGKLNLRKDIYSHDEKLAAELF